MGSRTKLFAATESARKKLASGDYKSPFKKSKGGCTALGCGVPAKPGAASTTPAADDKNGVK